MSSPQPPSGPNPYRPPNPNQGPYQAADPYQPQNPYPAQNPYSGPAPTDPYGTQGYNPIPGGPAPSVGPAGAPGPGPAAAPGVGGYPAYGPAQPGGPGQPPKKSGLGKVAIIVGAGVLALILVVVGLVALLGRNSTPSAGGGGGGSTGPVQSTAKASDAVHGYLQALAAGKAEDALGYGKDQPADKTFLTDAVLAESIKRAPITDINVPEVNDENAYQVSATYKIGGQPVSENFLVSKEGSDFRLTETTQDLSLGSVRSKTVPLIINKALVSTDKITVLPGSYSATTGIATIDYGSKNTFLIKSPVDLAPIQLTPTLTKTGSSAFVHAAKSAMSSCLKQHSLAPKGCPFAIHTQSGQKVYNNTIRWRLKGDPWSNLKPRLDYENPAEATASTSMQFTFSARGTQDGRPGTYGPQTIYEFVQMSGNVAKSPVKVSFG